MWVGETCARWLAGTGLRVLGVSPSECECVAGGDFVH